MGIRPGKAAPRSCCQSPVDCPPKQKTQKACLQIWDRDRSFCNHNTDDHAPQITLTNIIIKLKYFENYQNGAQRHRLSKCCWKTGTDRFAQRMVATDLQCVKAKRKQYLQSIIKRGMPVIKIGQATIWCRGGAHRQLSQIRETLSLLVSKDRHGL